MSTVYGWHFIREDKKLGYNDGREVRTGETLTVDCEPVLCRSGLHWSPLVIDALQYAPGPIACRVASVPGHSVIYGHDKVVSTARHCIGMGDATEVLWRLSRKWAASVFWEYFKREDYPSVSRWLDDGDFSARSAACAAAKVAASFRVSHPAGYAVRQAAWSAVWSADGESLYDITPAPRPWSVAICVARSAAKTAELSTEDAFAWQSKIEEFNRELQAELFTLLTLS